MHFRREMLPLSSLLDTPNSPGRKAMGPSPSVLLCWTRQRDISPIRKNTIDKEPFVKKWICSQKRII